MSLIFITKQSFTTSLGDTPLVVWTSAQSTSPEFEQCLHNRLGDKYYLIYDYYDLPLWYVHLVFFSATEELNLPLATGTPEQKVNQIITYLKQYKYLENQPNPELIPTVGGNCQAFAIVFYQMCNMADIPCKILEDDSHTHVYNSILIGSTSYTVDIINNIMKED